MAAPLFEKLATWVEINPVVPYSVGLARPTIIATKYIGPNQRTLEVKKQCGGSTVPIFREIHHETCVYHPCDIVFCFCAKSVRSNC